MNASNVPTDFDSVDMTESTGFEIDLLQLATKYWKWLLLGLLGGLILGELYYRKKGPEFEATARILVEKKVAIQIKEGDAKIYGDRAEHIALIMSPLIVSKAVETHHLDKLPSLIGEDEPVEEILGTLVVKRTAGRERSLVNVLDLNYRNKYKDDAKKVLDAVIEAYQQYMEDNQKKKQNQSLASISLANDEWEEKLKKKKAEHQKFRENSPLHWKEAPGVTGLQGSATNVHRDRFLKLEEKRRDLIIKKTETESRIAALEKAVKENTSSKELERMIRIFLSFQTGQSGQSIATQQNPDLVTLESRLVPLVLRERLLLSEFQKDHYDVIAVREQINTLRAIYREKGIEIKRSRCDGRRDR